MKLTGLEIENFGVWQHFRQALHPSGLTVFYGPNEAGKTTLLRFMRGVLYGFRNDDRPGLRRRFKPGPRSGFLRVEHNHTPYELYRSSPGEDPGALNIAGVEPGPKTSHLLQEILRGADEKLFESVFAVGLMELQQFATLTEDEVARHLYAMTLGPQGQLLMNLPDRIEGERRALIDPKTQGGRVTALLKRREELVQQTSSGRKQRERHRELLRQRGDLETQIGRERSEHARLKQHERGLQFMERIYQPWQLVRELQLELDALPDLRGFPADGLQRLDRLETDLANATKTRERLLQEAREQAERIQAIGRDPEIRKYGGAIAFLCEQRPFIRESDEYVAERTAKLEQSDARLQEMLTELGPTWTVERLDAVQDSPEDQATLVTESRVYQQVVFGTRRKQKRYKRRAAACQDRELALRTQLMDLGVHGDSLDEPLVVAHERLEQLVDLGKQQLRLAELMHRSDAIDEQLETFRDRMGLPDWVYGVLVLFGLAGVGLIIAGLTASVTHGWIVGLIYIVLAVLAGAITWAIKSHYDGEMQDEVEDLREQRRTNESRIRSVDAQIRDIIESCDLTPRKQAGDRQVDATDGELISQAARRLAALEQAQEEYKRIQGVRRQLSSVRGKLQLQQRELAGARQRWCQTLKGMGLDETVDIAAAFVHREKVAAAREQQRISRGIRDELQQSRLSWDRFRRQTEGLARRMGDPTKDFSKPLTLVDRWERELRTAQENRQERKRLIKEQQARRQDAGEWQRRVDKLEAEIEALLALASANDRKHLEQRLAQRDRRKQVEVLLEQAHRELMTAAQTDPDMAIIEEDLLRFRPQSNKEELKRVKTDLEDVELTLQDLFEQMGTVKQELKTLEADRSSSRTRQELALVEQELAESLTRWSAASLVAEAVEDVGERFEKLNQPEMLAAAVPFLKRLTCGKYHRLWAPLGRRHIYVEDDQGHSFPAEMLSGGTREQLFLSIRLAMVRAFSRQGLELPMILDDVTVNFDETRAQAAAETLVDFVRDGQQLIVFTSHQFFAHMFQSFGIEPVMLPSRNTPESGEERLAG